MVISMDDSFDHRSTMNSSPIDEASNATTRDSSPFQRQESVDDDHDEEHSKGSNQTVVLMQHRRHQHQEQHQHQADIDLQAEAVARETLPTNNDDEHDDNPNATTAGSEQQEPTAMVVSRGSSLDEDEDRRRMMNIDDTSGSQMPTNFTLNQAELEIKLTQAKKSTAQFKMGCIPATGMPVESSLVAQMRDIVEGGSIARRLTELRAADSSSGGGICDNSSIQEQGANKTRQESEALQQQAHQPKSSSDSLNQNENTSKTSIDSTAAQKRTRHSRGHCRHQNSGSHHHHHHHHLHQHRHRQSVSGASVSAASVQGSGVAVAASDDRAKSTSNPHHHHHHHHHHRHPDSNRQHGHHHHSHHPHHHHHQQDQRKSATAGRGTQAQGSNTMIEPTKLDANSPELNQEYSSSGKDQQLVAGGEFTNSSLSSVSSTKRGNCQADKSKSTSEFASEEPNQAEQQEQEQEQMKQEREFDRNYHHTHHQHHHHSHGHHHHHHTCAHRSHKKRLVLDAGDNQPEAIVKSDLRIQADGGATSASLDATKSQQQLDLHQSCESDVSKRKPLQDLSSSSANVVAELEGETSKTESTVTRQQSHAHHHHGRHNHHHHHHHHHHPHHHHHHNHHAHHAHVHCSHKQQAESLSRVSNIDYEAQQAGSSGRQQHLHRHQRHHHHNHGHHCKQHRQRSRQKSVSKTNVDGSGARKDSDKAPEGGTEAGAKNESSQNTNTSDRLLADDVVYAVDWTETCKNGGELRQNRVANDEVVKMELSPDRERKSSNAFCATTTSVIANDKQQQENRQPSSSGIKLSTADGPEASQANLTTNDIMTVDTINTQSIIVQNSDKSASEGNQNGSKDCSTSSRNVNNEIRDSVANQEYFNTAQDNVQHPSKLSRQMSSQSSKKSQRDEISGSGSGQNQNERIRECAERALQPVSVNQQQSSQPKSLAEPSLQSDRRCRLCWCCCCPCSALSVREGPNRPTEKPAKTSPGPPSSPVSKYPSLPNVPLDEIKSWGESFDKLMKCTDGRKVFQDFLRCEYSEENILFWAACEELKKEKDTKNVASKARDIYEDYISILSSKEVSLDSRVRDIINNNIKKPTSNIFDEAQLQIYTLMHRDSYPRFINSVMYKKLAQIPMSSSRKSSS